MKRIALCCLVLILTGVPASVNASGHSRQLGVRTDFTMDKLYTYTDMKGFGAGLTLKTPSSSRFKFVPEMNFSYRAGIHKPPFYIPEEYAIREMFISAHTMFHFLPFEKVPFYLVGGVQVQFPFYSRINITSNGMSVSESTDRLYSIITDTPLGLGCMLTPNLGIDFRLTNGPYTTSFRRFSLGASYFL
ncbi:MAG: hypothetical protein LBB56_06555 [Chitinispirillales bacterium]|jgi:hypothetical protein|nr:hypothetical protein [Chitinispirillales bacterium]